MLKLARRARGHFETLIEIRVHLIRVKPGHICSSVGKALHQHLRRHGFKSRYLSGVCERQLLKFSSSMRG